MHSQSKVSQVTGHSIWMLPDEMTSDLIGEVITNLSKQFKSPIFQPHLTLLGQIPGDIANLLPSFRAIGKSCLPLILKAGSLGMQDTFYRSLYYKIDLSPELALLNNQARELFNLESDDPFFPHISLLYSSASKSEKQLALSHMQLPNLREIPMTHICLMKTQGELKHWELVEQIKLK